MRKKGSNQYRDKWGFRNETKSSVLIMAIFMLLVVIAGREWQRVHPIISPCPEEGCSTKVYAAEPTPTPTLTIDQLVDKYATTYTQNESQKSWMKAIVHFLLYKESKHGADKQQGDGGLAGGPLQFHETTYVGFRRIMIDRGLTTYIGSRFDLNDAIETAIWAIADGRENNWGPIVRGEIKL